MTKTTRIYVFQSSANPEVYALAFSCCGSDIPTVYDGEQWLLRGVVPAAVFDELPLTYQKLLDERHLVFGQDRGHAFVLH